MKYTKIMMSLAVASTLSAGWFDSVSDALSAVTDNTPIKTESKIETTSSASSIMTSLSSNDMNGALKEALNKGVSYAIDALGQDNGYLDNPLAKIGLPKSMQTMADLVRKAGGDKYVDDLVLSINNAATEAAPKTAEIFAKSISSMSIEDAKKILLGSNGAATDYFRNTTTKDLQATISPIIEKSMQNNDVAKYYESFQSFYKENAGMLKNEYVSGAASMFGYGDMIPSDKDEDINAFVTNKSIDGIMVMIEEQEKKIRDNPLSQNSDLIGKVFSVFE
ncbi:MAG: DUF4197 domain-containing protein [Sulfurimonas sp.]|nr:DUF4197 domain-containing protein [Sulfurimonas sp.]MDQ7061620.1 DUF4197 domain-containing protein [Sulfurimonas sp.]